MEETNKYRKVFISFLGTGNYSSCQYCRHNFKSEQVRFVQTATLDYLLSNCDDDPWSENDTALFLLTEKARTTNWNNDGHTDRDGNVLLTQGLCESLLQKKYPFKCDSIDVPEGNNEAEIWVIFSSIFDRLLDGDHLYFDITHGYRYLPMLVLVLTNYAKFLRNVEVKSITYGNFEGRNKETNEAPIVDLLPLDNLQDWTIAVAAFLNSGDAEQLCSLTDKVNQPLLKASCGKNVEAANLRSFSKYLKNTVYDFRTCRGMNIVTSKNIKDLINIVSDVKENFITPLCPVIEKVEDAITSFDSKENLYNGIKAAEWCLKNKMFQQSATILQECVVSVFASRNGIEIDDEDKRELVNKAFIILFWDIKESDWKIAPDELSLLHNILTDIQSVAAGDRSLICEFNSLTELRNDINHSGMRKTKTPKKADRFSGEIKESIHYFDTILKAIL